MYEDFKAGLKSEEQGKRRSDSDIARSAKGDDPKLCSKKARVSLPKVDRHRHGHDGSKNRKRMFSHVAARQHVVESDSEYEVEEVVELCEWYPPDFWKSSLNLKVRIVHWSETWVDLDLDVPPSCPPAWPILPSFYLPKQNGANGGMSETKSTQPTFTTTSPTL